MSKEALQDGRSQVFSTRHSRLVDQQVPDRFSGSPLLVETFLHIHTWHMKYPKSGEQCSWEFDIKYAGIAGIAFNLSTLTQHKWNAQVNWTTSIADDMIFCPSTRSAAYWSRLLHAMGLDYHRSFPPNVDPTYHHVAASGEYQLPSISFQHVVAHVRPSSTKSCPAFL